MKTIISWILCLVFASITNAIADTNRFTATSGEHGVLGYMDFDSSTFDGTSAQFVSNASMLSLDFTNPLNFYHITTIGPVSAADGTYFDSSGSMPTLIGGYGVQGGTGTGDRVQIGSSSWANPIFLTLGNGRGNDTFSDVTWSTAIVGTIPEPKIYAMLGIGLGLMGWVGRRKKLQTA